MFLVVGVTLVVGLFGKPFSCLGNLSVHIVLNHGFKGFRGLHWFWLVSSIWVGRLFFGRSFYFKVLRGCLPAKWYCDSNSIRFGLFFLKFSAGSNISTNTSSLSTGG